MRRPRGLVRGFVRGALLLLGALLTAAVVAALLITAWWAADLPPLTKVTDYRPRQHLQVLTADGQEMAAFGSEKRIFVPMAQMPPQLTDAVLAIEDTQFHEHAGISFKGLARAIVANLGGGMPQGASTITQQVARNFFLSTRRTPERKVKEALLALRIERALGKNEILELYMNQIHLGQGAYGFGAAAQVYFGKPLAAVSLAEAALLAGLPQNPTHANPVVNAQRARRRQLLVLGRMLAIGRITAAQHDAAVTEPLVLRSARVPDLHAEHVAEAARQAVVARFGDQAYSQGLRVHTTLRADEQRAAHAALRRAVITHERRQAWRGPEAHEPLPAGLSGEALEHAAALALKDHRDDDDLRVAIVLEAGPTAVRAQLADGEVVDVGAAGLRQAAPGLQPRAPPARAIRRGAVIRLWAEPGREGARWHIVQWPEVDAAFVALDAASGRVRALVGGFDFQARPFNHATQAWRQPGSSFTPFVLAAAFDRGVMPETLVDDLPLTPEEGARDGWNPQNNDGRFDGPLSVRDAMLRSKDLVSLRVLRLVGLPAAQAWIARFGFDPRRHPDDLTLALGAGSVTPLQLAAGYAVLANGGWRVDPVLIERIVDPQGQVLFEAAAPPALTEDRRAVPAPHVFLVNSLLADEASRGSAAAALGSLRRGDLHGRPGTGTDAVDAWFAGFQPGLVAVSWIGHAEPRGPGGPTTASDQALQAWVDFMRTARGDGPVQPLPVPEGVLRGATDWRLAAPAGDLVLRIGAPLAATGTTAEGRGTLPAPGRAASR